MLVSQAAAVGALVSDASAAPSTPLVLGTADGDSPANQQRAFELLQPAARALFRVDPTTAALALAAPLDYERQSLHTFTVKVCAAAPLIYYSTECYLQSTLL